MKKEEPDLLEVTGKNNKVFTSGFNVFMNTDVLFIEYDDVIRSPMFIFLYMLHDNKAIEKIFDLSEFEGKSFEEIYEWYVQRDDKNVIKSMELQEDALEKFFDNSEEKFDEWADAIYQNELAKTEILFKDEMYLNFDAVLRRLLGEKRDQKLVDKIYIWSPYESEFIKKDVMKRYGSSIKVVFGSLEDIIEKEQISENSSYVFSDLRHINTLIKTKHFELASIMIADTYWYNYDEEFDPVVNIDELRKKFIFKLDFFNNLTIE